MAAHHVVTGWLQTFLRIKEAADHVTATDRVQLQTLYIIESLLSDLEAADHVAARDRVAATDLVHVESLLRDLEAGWRLI